MNTIVIKNRQHIVVCLLSRIRDKVYKMHFDGIIRYGMTESNSQYIDFCGGPLLTKGAKINNRTIKEIFGHEKVEKIEFDDGTDINVNGIFIAQGTADSTDIAKKIGLVLENNKIKVNENMETNIKGIYACGDCIGGILQISKAVNDGMKTGLNVIKFLK